ncbi:MAG: hypothetical protein WC565_02665 [Parcubacteria group bacterium]
MFRLSEPSGLILLDDILTEKPDYRFYHIRPENIPKEHCVRFGNSTKAVEGLLAVFKKKGFWGALTITERAMLLKNGLLEPDDNFSNLIDQVDAIGPRFTFRSFPPCYVLKDAAGTFYVTKFFIGLLAAPDHVFKERKVRIKNVPRGDVCTPGDEYCWECGYVAPAEIFFGRDRCPNPNCPHPGNWND